MKRRILSVLLTMCMVLGLIPSTAMAAGNLPFTDVGTTDWFRDAVEYVYERELMAGTSETAFSPSATTTRGMIVTILHRMEGKPEAEAAGFSDVAEDAYCAAAIDWAAATGIVNGYGNGTFGPSAPITRQQLAAILYRYVTYKGYKLATADDLSRFSDVGNVESYALDAMKWAVGAGLINGTQKDVLSPAGSATRAQTAVILMRLMEMIDAQSAETGKPVSGSSSGSSSSGGGSSSGDSGNIGGSSDPSDPGTSGGGTADNGNYHGAIEGITVVGSTVTVAVAPEEGCTLVVKILDETTEEVLWADEMEVKEGDKKAELSVSIALPEYFVVTGQLVDAEDAPLNNLYTCLDYTRGFEIFSAKTESDFPADRVLDVAGKNDGNFIVLGDGVKRLEMTPVSETDGIYTFAKDDNLVGLAQGDKICFLNGDGVYVTIRVAAVSVEGETVVITKDDSATISDLYEVIKINASIKAYQETSQSPLMYRFAGGEDPLTATAVHYAAAKDDEESDESHYFSGIEMGPALSSNVKTSFGSFDATLRAGGQIVSYYDPKIWGDDYMRVDIITRVLMEGDLVVGPTDYVHEEKLLFPEVSLAGLEIIGHFPMKLTGVFEATCQAGLGMHLSAEIGAGYTHTTVDGGQKYTYKAVTPSEVDAEGSAEVSIGVRYSVGVGLLDDLLEASIGVGAGVGLEGEIEVAVTPTFSTVEYHACDTCMDGRFYAYANANVNLSYEVNEKIQDDIFNLEIIRAEWTIGKVYISLLNDSESIHKGEIVFDWGECPNKKYLVTLLTYNNGKQESGHTVTVLDHEGYPVTSGESTLKTYLYPGTYAAETTIHTNEVSENFVVLEAKTVYLYGKDAFLHGTVTDDKTGEPLSGAKVMVLKENEVYQTVQTDEGGDYALTLPGGAYKVSFVAEGYTSQVIVLSNLQADKNLDAALEPIVDPGVLAGVVADKETGEPISNAVITLSQEGKDDTLRYTNDNGRYEVELEVGEYSIDVVASDYAPFHGSVTVIGNETITKNIYLEHSTGTVRGTITAETTEDGPQFTGATVELRQDGTLIKSINTSADGTYSFTELRTGTYSIRAFADGFGAAAGTVVVNEASTTVYNAVLGSNMCGDDLYWTFDDGALTIFGEGPMYNYDFYNISYEPAPWSVAYSDEIVTIIVEEGTTSLGKDAFSNLKKVESVELPVSLKTIGSGAFEYCEALTSLDLPGQLESVGMYAFQYSGVKRLELPDSVTKIDQYAFQDSGLEHITLSENMITIPYGAFYRSKNLASVEIPYGIKSIAQVAFNQCAIKELILPDSVTTLADKVFSGCGSFEHVKLSKNITKIPEQAFYNCSKLKSIEIPEGVKSIGQQAFMYCESLTSVTIPASVQQIQGYAFYECKSLETISIPEGISEIKAMTFEGCGEIGAMYLPVSLKKFNVDSMSGAYAKTVYYAGSEEQWKEITIIEWTKFGNVEMSVAESGAFKNAEIHFNWLQDEPGTGDAGA